MVTTIAISVALGLVGLAFGTFSIHAARTRRLPLRLVAAVLMIGTMGLTVWSGASVWVLVGYLAGIAASFFACDAILDRLGVESDEPTVQS